MYYIFEADLVKGEMTLVAEATTPKLARAVARKVCEDRCQGKDKIVEDEQQVNGEKTTVFQVKDEFGDILDFRALVQPAL